MEKMALDKFTLKRIYAHLNCDLLKFHNLWIIFERNKKIVPKKLIIELKRV